MNSVQDFARQIVPMSSLTDHAFYDDPELYTTAGQNVSAGTVYSFPSREFSGFAASFPGDPFHGDVTSSESRSLAETCSSGDIRTINSPQVVQFWERYKLYPRYLKNVGKRQKRKIRKKAQSQKT